MAAAQVASSSLQVWGADKIKMLRAGRLSRCRRGRNRSCTVPPALINPFLSDLSALKIDMLRMPGAGQGCYFITCWPAVMTKLSSRADVRFRLDSGFLRHGSGEGLVRLALAVNQSRA